MAAERDLKTYIDQLEKEVAEARVAREARAAGEAKLRLLVQQMPAIVWTTDCDLRLTSLMGGGLADLGLRPEELVGRTLPELTGEEDLPALAATRRALAGESAKYVLEWRGHAFQTDIEPLRDSQGRITGTLGVSVDFTERRRAEEALVISQARIASVVNLSEDAIISVDPQQRITLFNYGAEKIFGYSAEEVLGKPLDVLLPERLADAHGGSVREFGGSAGVLRPNERGELFGRRKDGMEFAAEASVSNFEVAGEKVINVRLRDIAGRKRFEAELKARARQQAAVAEIGQYALQITDLSALMRRICELITQTLELEFCKVLELLPDAGSLLLRAGIGWKEGLVGNARLSAGSGSHAGFTLLSTGPVLIEDLAAETRFAEPLLQDHGIVSGVSVIIHTHQGPFGVLGAHTRQRRIFTRDDINFLQAVANVLSAAIERSRTEEALRETNETLRVVNEASPVAIWSIDLEGRVTFWNPAAERTFGWSREEVLHQRLPIEAEPGSELQLPESHAREEVLQGLETRFPRRDGTLLDVSLWSAPLRDRSGAVCGTLVVAVDITERKRLEEQLRQSQKLESVGLLAGGVAHDFNNLLTGIMGNLSLALDGLPQDNPRHNMLANALRASERAADLVRQLLAYSGKGRFVLRRVDLSALVRELVTLLKTSLPKKVQLVLSLEEELPPVEGDSSQLQQLIMNLVINAAEAIGDRPGTVVVTTRTQDVDREYLRSNFVEELDPGQYVYLEVHDTGCGMDDETIRRIFEPFFSTKFTGRGLGLAAVSGIVRGHRGTIRVYSTPGRGSTFKVLLPAAAAPAPRHEEVRPEQVLTGSGTVLVVDDEDIVLTTARATLERYGYSVVVAENGRGALQIVADNRQRIDLVLLDMSMPLMSGEETLVRLREIRPDLAVIVSSGYNEVEAIRRFARQGIAGFLQKPYTSSQLAEKVKALMPTTRTSSGSGGA